MRMVLQSTATIVDLDGVKTVLWHGHTESGVRVHAFIARLRVDSARQSSPLTAADSELFEWHGGIARDGPEART